MTTKYEHKNIFVTMIHIQLVLLSMLSFILVANSILVTKINIIINVMFFLLVLSCAIYLAIFNKQRYCLYDGKRIDIYRFQNEASTIFVDEIGSIQKLFVGANIHTKQDKSYYISEYYYNNGFSMLDLLRETRGEKYSTISLRKAVLLIVLMSLLYLLLSAACLVVINNPANILHYAIMFPGYLLVLPDAVLIKHLSRNIYTNPFFRLAKHGFIYLLSSAIIVDVIYTKYRIIIKKHSSFKTSVYYCAIFCVSFLTTLIYLLIMFKMGIT